MLLYVVAVRHRMESESGPQSETRATGLKHSTRSPAPNPLSVFSALASSKNRVSYAYLATGVKSASVLQRRCSRMANFRATATLALPCPRFFARAC